MKILMQQADAACGGQGAAAGAAAAAAAAAAGAAGAGAAQGQSQQQGAGQSNTTTQQQGAAGQSQQKTGETTNQGKGTSDTSQEKPSTFVPKLPDGAKMDETVLKEFWEIQSDPKLTPEERAQKTVDLQIKGAQMADRAFRDRLAAQPAKDLESLKADPAFGGPNFQATVEGAKKIEQFAFGDELGKLLSPLGLQSHPVILKGLARLSRVIAEDSIGTNTGNGPTGESDAEKQGRALFPNSWDTMKKDTRRR